MIRGNESVGLTLAHEGYDVWFGNSRGNTNSKEHLTLNPYANGAKTYWNFSFEELGDYDLPAIIDYILEETEYTKLGYLAHSMGASQMLYAMSRNLEYFKDRISFCSFFSPAVLLSHSTSPMLLSIVNYVPTLAKVFEFLNMFEMFPNNPKSNTLAIICDIVPDFCHYLEKQSADLNPEYNDRQAASTFVWMYPAGASMKSIVHMSQIFKAQRYQRFDFGDKALNMIAYD